MISTGGTYRELAARWESLRDGDRVRLRHIKIASAGRELLLVDIGDGRSASVALAAGVHGDEPAGPWALLGLAEDGALSSEFAYRIWPCTNPSGFAAGTRESAEGVDLNRTFGDKGSSPEASALLAANPGRRFALSLDLHEDCDAQGFYCYEYGAGEIGRRAVGAVADRGLPIDPLDRTFDLAGPLSDEHCTRERGRVVADPLREAASLGGLSYSLAIAGGGARHALTFETPASAPWNVRVEMHQTAVIAAIRALLEESACAPFN